MIPSRAGDHGLQSGRPGYRDVGGWSRPRLDTQARSTIGLRRCNRGRPTADPRPTQRVSSTPAIQVNADTSCADLEKEHAMLKLQMKLTENQLQA